MIFSPANLTYFVQDCFGIDTDYDGVPDNCDFCPFIFDPDQPRGGCGTEGGGVCPSLLTEGVLWTETEGGYTNIRSCPSALIGKYMYSETSD